MLVPFALWNKTAFLAEKVLGNVVSSGIKVLVLAVIVGIGSGLFSEFNIPAGSGAVDRPGIGHHAGLARDAGPGHLWAGHRDGAGVRWAAAWRRRDGWAAIGAARNRWWRSVPRLRAPVVP